MVTVFGLGFVGLTTALGFAHMGYKVYGIDVDTERKNTLRAGRLPFMEPHMEEQLKKHLGQNFFIVDEVEKAVADSSYVFYCVGTPYGQEGSADLSYLLAAVDETVAAVSDDKFRVLVIKSTVPPSTTAEKIYPYVQSKGVISQQFGVANNPEFLREGHCWEDFIGADRIVLGCSDKRSKEMLEELFEGKTYSGQEGRKPLKIIRQDIDIPEDNDEDVDTDLSAAPYIKVAMTGGEIPDDDSPQLVEFSLTICAYDTGTKHEGFRDVVVLPRGTNTPLEHKGEAAEAEAGLLLQKNKWVIAHPDREPLIKQGAHPGLLGENKELFY